MEDKVAVGSDTENRFIIFDMDMMEDGWLEPYEGDMLLALLSKLIDKSREKGYKAGMFKLELTETRDIPTAESITNL